MSAFDVLVGYLLGMAVGSAIATRFSNASWRRLVDTLREDRGEWRAIAVSTGEQLGRLTQQVVSLKRKGFEPSSAGKVVAPPDPETNALRRVEEKFTQQLQERRAAADREFVDAAVQDLVNSGLSLEAAKKEAARIRAEVTDSHPAGG